MEEEIKKRFDDCIKGLPPRKKTDNMQDYETPEAPKASAPRRTCTNHESLKNIYKELHTIAQELEKINRTLAKRK